MNAPGKPPLPAIGVSAIVFDEQGRVLLVRRGRAPALGLWHAPGGRQEPGEGLIEACRREVREETGLDVVVGPVMAVVERRVEGFHYVIIDFLAHLAAIDQASARAADDAVEVAWVAEHHLQDYELAEGLLPILQRAKRERLGETLGLADSNGQGTDFLSPIKC